MSEPQSAPTEPEVPFDPEELKQFDADDAEAGRAIGRMLSMFFLYTVIVMVISSVATYVWVTSPSLQ